MGLADFTEHAKETIASSIRKFPFYTPYQVIEKKDSFSFKIGSSFQYFRALNDREMAGIKLFWAIWELPLFSGPKPDDETCFFLNQANLCSPTSPLIYDPKQGSYELLINIRINPDNLKLMTQLLPLS